MWTNCFSSLLNAQQHKEELTTMSDPTAVVEHQYFTEHDVESAVKRSKSGKAPGCNIVPNEAYKAGEHEMVRRLTLIFNQAYREECVPTEWGQAEICPIYKEKGDFPRCENYRGVSLMSHACKLYESVLECRLINIAEERLGPRQHGFRKGVGTIEWYDMGFKISYREALGIQSTPFHSFSGSWKSLRQRAQRETVDGVIHGTGWPTKSDKKTHTKPTRAEWAQTSEVENGLPQNQVFAKEA